MTRLLAALCLSALPLPALAQAPLAANDVVATTAGTPIGVDVLANDSDPDGDQLFADPFASKVVPFEVGSLANMPPVIGF